MTKLYIYEACQIVLKKSNDVVIGIIDLKGQDKLHSSIAGKLKHMKTQHI